MSAGKVYQHKDGRPYERPDFERLCLLYKNELIELKVNGKLLAIVNSTTADSVKNLSDARLKVLIGLFERSLPSLKSAAAAPTTASSSTIQVAPPPPLVSRKPIVASIPPPIIATSLPLLTPAASPNGAYTQPSAPRPARPARPDKKADRGLSSTLTIVEEPLSPREEGARDGNGKLIPPEPVERDTHLHQQSADQPLPPPPPSLPHIRYAGEGVAQPSSTDSWMGGQSDDEGQRNVRGALAKHMEEKLKNQSGASNLSADVVAQPDTKDQPSTGSSSSEQPAAYALHTPASAASVTPPALLPRHADTTILSRRKTARDSKRHAGVHSPKVQEAGEQQQTALQTSSSAPALPPKRGVGRPQVIDDLRRQAISVSQSSSASKVPADSPPLPPAGERVLPGGILVSALSQSMMVNFTGQKSEQNVSVSSAQPSAVPLPPPPSFSSPALAIAPSSHTGGFNLSQLTQENPLTGSIYFTNVPKAASKPSLPNAGKTQPSQLRTTTPTVPLPPPGSAPAVPPLSLDSHAQSILFDPTALSTVTVAPVVDFSAKAPSSIPSSSSPVASSSQPVDNTPVVDLRTKAADLAKTRQEHEGLTQQLSSLQAAEEAARATLEELSRQRLAKQVEVADSNAYLLAREDSFRLAQETSPSTHVARLGQEKPAAIPPRLRGAASHADKLNAERVDAQLQSQTASSAAAPKLLSGALDSPVVSTPASSSNDAQAVNPEYAQKIADYNVKFAEAQRKKAAKSGRGGCLIS